MKSATATARPFLAREPIVNRRMRVLGCQVKIADASVTVGPEEVRLVGRGLPAFLPVTRQSLLSPATAALHPGHVVFELPADLSIDDELLRVCDDLRERGYRFSIDDFRAGAPAQPLLEHASYLKIDCSEPSHDDTRARLVATCSPGKTAVVGTGVHTAAQVESAARDGFEYFQGFVLHESGVAANAHLDRSHLPLLQLLKALNNPRLSIGQFEDLVMHDPALCYRILQTVNSAAFGLRTTVYSMGQAILLLGRDPIRRWASLWTMAGLGADSHDEVIVMAAVRARLCEAVVSAAEGPEAGGEAFLLGMCSTFNVMFGRPMEEIVAELPIEEAAKDVLCGKPGKFRHAIDCVCAYERGEWAEASAAARLAGHDVRVLPGAFMEALRWARELGELGTQISLTRN